MRRKTLIGTLLALFIPAAVIAASSGISTRQTLTGAPGPVNLNGVSASEGSSNAHARADHVHSLSGTLPVANGGTGVTSATSDAVLVGNGSAWQAKVVPDCDMSSRALQFDQTSNNWSCNTSIDAATLDGSTWANPPHIGSSTPNDASFLDVDLADLYARTVTAVETGVAKGLNYGVSGTASGANTNFGVIGGAITSKSGAVNAGVWGVGANTSGTAVGGWFTLDTATPTWESAALVADNASSPSPIFLGKDNGSTVFAINDGGSVNAGAISASSLSVTGDVIVNGSGSNTPGRLGRANIVTFSALINTTTTNCTVVDGFNATVGTSRCSRLTTGTYEVKFTTALSSTPVCNVTSGTSDTVVAAEGSSSGVAWITQPRGSGSRVDGKSVNIICVGGL